jgi:orotate phosphoribosyltransferase
VNSGPTKFVFVAGPYRGRTPQKTDANIKTAVDVGRRVFQKGYYPIVPHVLVRPYYDPENKSGPFGYEPLMKYTLSMLSRCDVLLLYGHSPGADREWHEAERFGMPVYFAVKDLPELPKVRSQPSPPWKAHERLEMERSELALRVYETSHIEGHFILRSGKSSNEYFDKYLFEATPLLLKAIAQHMVSMVPDNCDALAGLEMGGIPVVTMLSQLTRLPALFVRKRAKEHGTCKLAEGPDVAGKHLVVVEDVVTSGGQIIESTKALRALGATVTDVICVIDRELGADENLAKQNLAFRALFTISELKRAAEPGAAAGTDH